MCAYDNNSNIKPRPDANDNHITCLISSFGVLVLPNRPGPVADSFFNARFQKALFPRKSLGARGGSFECFRLSPTVSVLLWQLPRIIYSGAVRINTVWVEHLSN